MLTTFGRLTINGRDITPSSWTVDESDAVIFTMAPPNGSLVVLAERDRKVRRWLRWFPKLAARLAPGRQVASLGLDFTEPHENLTVQVHGTTSI